MGLMSVLMPYTPPDSKARDEAWRKNQDKAKEAISGLNARLANRGRSFNGMQLLKALLAAAEVSFVAVALAIGIDHHLSLMVASTLPACVGLACLIIGIIPRLKALNPNPLFRGDEFIEALTNNERAWLTEIVHRSMDQRSLLRRGRIWLAASCVSMLFAIGLFMVSIVQLIQQM